MNPRQYGAPVDTTPDQQLPPADRIARFGFECPDCGHRHGGQAVAFICIGCACRRRFYYDAGDTR